MTIAVGTVLHAHKGIVFSGTPLSEMEGKTALTAGWDYTVVEMPNTALGRVHEPHFFAVTDDAGCTRIFSTDRTHDFYYGKWFHTLATEDDIEYIKSLLNSN